MYPIRAELPLAGMGGRFCSTGLIRTDLRGFCFQFLLIGREGARETKTVTGLQLLSPGFALGRVQNSHRHYSCYLPDLHLEE